MNKYVEEVMNKKEGLPKTFEEYQLMHPVHSRLVPMSHVQLLRNEFDNRVNQSKPVLKPIDFK
jgi:hypothetical protein